MPCNLEVIKRKCVFFLFLFFFFKLDMEKDKKGKDHKMAATGISLCKRTCLVKCLNFGFLQPHKCKLDITGEKGKERQDDHNGDFACRFPL